MKVTEESRPEESEPGEQEALILFRLALDGDEQAWTKLFHIQEAHMRRVVSQRIPAMLRPRLDTEDLMQSAFFELTQHGSGLEISDARSLRAWLGRVLMNKLRDRIRAAETGTRAGLGAPRPRTEDFEQHPADGPTLEDMAQRAELLARMYDRILALDPVDRHIVILRFVDRLPWTEVAKRTGLAAATASKRYNELLDQMVRGFF